MRDVGGGGGGLGRVSRGMRLKKCDGGNGGGRCKEFDIAGRKGEGGRWLDGNELIGHAGGK